MIVSITIHVRFGGESFDFNGSHIDVGEMSTDTQVKSAVATQLNVEPTKLSNFYVDRTTPGTITVRPEAVFG
jgi:hypothetical protein